MWDGNCQNDGVVDMSGAFVGYPSALPSLLFLSDDAMMSDGGLSTLGREYE
jgi:hypothetical protein